MVVGPYLSVAVPYWYFGEVRG